MPIKFTDILMRFIDTVIPSYQYLYLKTFFQLYFKATLLKNQNYKPKKTPHSPPKKPTPKANFNMLQFSERKNGKLGIWTGRSTQGAKYFLHSSVATARYSSVRNHGRRIQRKRRRVTWFPPFFLCFYQCPWVVCTFFNLNISVWIHNTFWDTLTLHPCIMQFFLISETFSQRWVGVFLSLSGWWNILMQASLIFSSHPVGTELNFNYTYPFFLPQVLQRNLHDKALSIALFLHFWSYFLSFH